MSMMNSIEDRDDFLRLTPVQSTEDNYSMDGFTPATDVESPDHLLEPSDTNVYYGLTGCVCSMLSLIIGCGIISMPYSASIVNSVWVFMAINIFCILLILASAMIYIHVRESVLKTHFS